MTNQKRVFRNVCKVLKTEMSIRLVAAILQIKLRYILFVCLKYLNTSLEPSVANSQSMSGEKGQAMKCKNRPLW